jgi:hypothetical protein
VCVAPGEGGASKWRSEHWKELFKEKEKHKKKTIHIKSQNRIIPSSTYLSGLQLV